MNNLSFVHCIMVDAELQQCVLNPPENRNSKRKIRRSWFGCQDVDSGSSITDGETDSVMFRVQHAQLLLTALDNFRRRDELCDVKLNVSGKKIKAHRVILAAISPYFSAMFTSDLVESKERIVCLNGMDPLSVQMVVDFAYVAHVDITVHNVQSLLAVASMLQVEVLMGKCCEFLENKLHPSNCLGVKRFAESHGCFKLGKIAYQYAQRNFSQMTQHEEFLQSPFEDVLELIRKDSLHVRHEEEVYEAAVRWARYNLKERLVKVPQLAEEIRFPLMAWEFLVTKVLDDGLISGNPQSNHLFEEARRHHLCPQLRSEFSQSNRLRPRKLYGEAEWIYVVGGETIPGRCTVTTVERFNPSSDTWHEVSSLLTPRRSLGVAILDGILYAVGGSDGIAALRQVECYDPSVDAWTVTNSMNEHRSSVGVAVLDGLLYAVGGYNGQMTVNTAERYNPRTGEWNMIAEMTTERSMLGMASLNGALYAVGGYNSERDLSSVEYYSSGTNQWSLVSPMKTPRSMVGVAVLNGLLFAIGGYNEQSLESVEVHNPETDIWTIITPMKDPRSGVGTAVINGNLYVVGGHNGTDYLSSVEVFHPRKKRWTTSGNMITNRRRFACCS